MRRVILETPYYAETLSGVEANKKFARRCMADCLSRGEAPFASHLLYTQVLDDNKPEQRRLGIAAGLAWHRVAEATVVYLDLGISGGMHQGIDAAKESGRLVEYRYLEHRREYGGTK